MTVAFLTLFAVSTGLWLWLGPFTLKTLVILGFLILSLKKSNLFKYKHYYSFAILLVLGFEFFLFRNEDWLAQWQMLKYTTGFFFFAMASAMWCGGFKPKSFILFWNLMSIFFLVENQNLNPIILTLISIVVFVFYTQISSIKTKKNLIALIITLSLIAPVSFGFFKVRPYFKWRNYYQNKQEHKIGFDRSSQLNSFASLYADTENDKIILRVLSKKTPGYLGGQSYDTYKKGIWSSTQKNKTLLPRGSKYNHFNYLGEALNADSVQYLIFPEFSTREDWIFTKGPYDQVSLPFDSIYENNGRYIYPQPIRATPYYLIDAGRDSLDEYQSKTFFPAELLAIVPLNSKLSIKELIQSLNQWFTKEFEYSLNIKTPKNKDIDPIVHFINSKQGYCEYFASTATLILQANGFKARYVKGFAFPTQLDNEQWAYTSSKAHAWVEYLDKGIWKVWDPTPPGMFPVASKNAQDFWMQNQFFKLKQLWFKWQNGEWINNLESILLALVNYIPIIVIMITLIFFGLKFRWNSKVKFIDHLLAKYNLLDLKNKPLLIQSKGLKKFLTKAEFKKIEQLEQSYKEKRFKS